MTPGVRVHVVMPSDLVERIDVARGEGQSRGDWVRRAVERALDDMGADDAPEPRVSSPRPAPAEQPTIAELRDAWELERRRVSPLRPVSPRVPFRRDVRPFPRGES